MSEKSLTSFTVFSQIDEGSFGRIYLVRKNGGIDDGKTYAMKSIKSKPTSEEHHNICRNELNMLKLVHGASFIIQLKYACKTQHYYHLIMDYMTAGNLFDYLQTGRLTLEETTICCAEIVLAIQYLHEQRIVYRDLKLENILISEDYHILIADFGLARKIQNDERLHDEAGTVAYFAPEILESGKGHSFEVDWWSLGIIAYELLIGHTPFLVSAREKVSNRLHRTRIQNDEPRIGDILKSQNYNKVSDLISKLLVKDPEKRLGVGQAGYNAVKDHPFFSKLNWRAVRLKVYNCLKKRGPTGIVKLNFNDQHEITFEESTGRQPFHFIAPELQIRQEDYFHGFTEDDLKDLPSQIRREKPEYHIQLKLDLFMRTTEPVEMITQLIRGKKTLRFSENVNIINDNSNDYALSNDNQNHGSVRSNRLKQRRDYHRHNLYPKAKVTEAATDTTRATETDDKLRRSKRVKRLCSTP